MYLHQIGRLDLLPALDGSIVVPEGVMAELDAGRALGVALPDPRVLPWASVRAVRNAGLLPLAVDLGQGEREVLAITQESPGALAILDDGLARQHGRLLGIRLTGTLGVLLKAKQTGHVDQVAPLVDQLEQLRFRLDAGTRAAVLELARER